MKRALAYLVMVIVPVLAISGCSGKAAKTVSGAKPAEITVAAAADLKAALPEVIKAFEKKTGIKVTATYGSSGLLAAQIENGAPFDVFLSANEEFVDRLAANKLLTYKRMYARGLVVLVGSAESLDELAKPGITAIAMANPEHAPYGQAAREALEKAGLWSSVESKIVLAENVAQALEFVKTGNADVAFTANSLAQGDELAFTRIDPDIYTPIEQWAAASTTAKNLRDARGFIDFLLTKDAREILDASGFRTLPISTFIKRSPHVKPGEL